MFKTVKEKKNNYKNFLTKNTPKTASERFEIDSAGKQCPDL